MKHIIGRTLLAILASGLVIAQYPAHASSGVALVVLAFAAAMFVLDLFDVLLPHGQSIGVDGALAAAALTLLGPVIGSVAVVIARLVALAATRQGSVVQGLELLERRLVALMLTAVLLNTRPGLLLAELGPLAVAAVAAVSLLLAELAYAQLQTSLLGERSLFSLIKGNLRLQMPMLAAQVSACALTVITYQQMGAWALIMAVFLLLLIRQSYALLLDVRDAYRTTVALLIDAAESTRRDLAGHAERVAGISRRIASQLGLSASEIETISYAAMLHDVDLIAEEGDETSRRRSGEIAAGVEFLAGVVPILRICDGDADAADVAAERHLLAAFIVALASDIDGVVVGTGDGGSVRRVTAYVPEHVRGRVAGAAIALGYPTPAMNV